MNVSHPSCLECGYDLTGLPDEYRCPECGATYRFDTNYEWRPGLLGKWILLGPPLLLIAVITIAALTETCVPLIAVPFVMIWSARNAARLADWDYAVKSAGSYPRKAEPESDWRGVWLGISYFAIQILLCGFGAIATWSLLGLLERFGVHSPWIWFGR